MHPNQAIRCAVSHSCYRFTLTAITKPWGNYLKDQSEQWQNSDLIINENITPRQAVIAINADINV